MGKIGTSDPKNLLTRNSAQIETKNHLGPIRTIFYFYRKVSVSLHGITDGTIEK